MFLSKITIPTHRCSVCHALWRLWPKEEIVHDTDFWNLVSKSSGPCCDQDGDGRNLIPITGLSYFQNADGDFVVILGKYSKTVPSRDGMCYDPDTIVATLRVLQDRNTGLFCQYGSPRRRPGRLIVMEDGRRVMDNETEIDYMRRVSVIDHSAICGLITNIEARDGTVIGIIRPCGPMQWAMQDAITAHGPSFGLRAVVDVGMAHEGTTEALVYRTLDIITWDFIDPVTYPPYTF